MSDKREKMTEHNCDEALERLYEYLDEELDNVTTAGIKQHLIECGSCDRGFDFERRLKVVIRERLSEEVPPQFIARLRVAIESESHRH
jgi:mycothiol system anti-sigma-R factor